MENLELKNEKIKMPKIWKILKKVLKIKKS